MNHLVTSTYKLNQKVNNEPNKITNKNNSGRSLRGILQRSGK